MSRKEEFASRNAASIALEKQLVIKNGDFFKPPFRL